LILAEDDLLCYPVHQRRGDVASHITNRPGKTLDCGTGKVTETTAIELMALPMIFAGYNKIALILDASDCPGKGFR
jgi:acid phosphatase class B